MKKRAVLIANRGEIACRILRTVQMMGLDAVAVYSDADASSPHVRHSDRAVAIGPASASESYLRSDHILAAAHSSGAHAIHPGYGFLSENPDFATAVEDAGLFFCGPTPHQIRAFGRKDSARRLAEEVGVPLLPGSGVLAGIDDALSEAGRVGYPVMLKSTAGGGGIGMEVCAGPDDLAAAFRRVAHLSQAGFGSGDLYLERYLQRARHVEVQVFGDGRGEVLALGARDCSLQRRNQKVIEETPAPGLPAGLGERLAEAALRLCRSVDYRSAGTVEFLMDAETGDAFFLEVNTRLQVEHTVTEEVYGIDLVQWMVSLAFDEWEAPALAPARGHAIQARLYAEDAARDFRPSPGLLTEVVFPEGVRCDTWVEPGTDVTPHYDPLLAKIVVHGSDRDDALRKMGEALAATEIHGVESNLPLLRAAIAQREFAAGAPALSIIGGLDVPSPTVEVIDPGLQSSLHEHPGRLGYWAVGVPPSGPMDDRSCRLVNRVLGNPEGATALEATRLGPTLRFATATTICLGGAVMDASLDGAPVAWWQPVPVEAGQVLRLGPVVGAGARTYLAVSGGFVVPSYLGSGTTFVLGGFGGHGGRALRAGDVLRIGDAGPRSNGNSLSHLTDLNAAVPVGQLAVALANWPASWELGVLYGPHAAPEFFTPDYIEELLQVAWRVHHNSDRTGVRLVGPRPGWVRADGGDAGIHPSNIHDTPYAVGAVDFTGDLPVILGPDGPSLGGFVCPVTVVAHERWKLGQLSPGDEVRFRLLDPAGVEKPGSKRISRTAILTRGQADGGPEVVYRRSGDENVLVEYGPQALDIAVRMRVHALETWLSERHLPGVVDITAGIRSLQLHYDPGTISLDRVMETLSEAEDHLPDARHAEVPTRIVNLPLSWEDDAALLAVERYMMSVRADAPWCPSNAEFIRRVNGLPTVDDVREIVYSASYLVLGLGDVYLGAPVAVPLDPRQRLVTTKYNPARTWTPENAVGIGGSYMCIYGMEGPGGYQLVGRTVPVWRTWRRGTDPADPPWLLRLFDQIRFFPVTPAELVEWRRGVRDGTRQVEITEETFRLKDHLAKVAGIADEVSAFRTRREAAFRDEISRWADEPAEEAIDGAPATPAAAGSPVSALLAGNVWRVEAAAGDDVREGDVLATLEAMKMEVPVTAPRDGTVSAVLCAPGDLVMPGQALMTLA